MHTTQESYQKIIGLLPDDERNFISRIDIETSSYISSPQINTRNGFFKDTKKAAKLVEKARQLHS